MACFIDKVAAFILIIYFSTFSGSGFFKKESTRQPTNAPINIANAYISGFPIVGRTKIPPCGARSVQLNAIDHPPAVAEPMMQEGMTLNGSFAANGIAPSEIKDNPII